MGHERHERDLLTDEAWARLEPLLPAQTPRTVRTAKAHRLVQEGILWVLRIGAPRRDLPAWFGRWHTVASRFYRWGGQRIWDRALADLQRQADTVGALDWSIHYVAGTVIPRKADERPATNVRSCRVPRTEPRRAAGKPTQAVPPRRPSLREVGRPLVAVALRTADADAVLDQVLRIASRRLTHLLRGEQARQRR